MATNKVFPDWQQERLTPRVLVPEADREEGGRGQGSLGQVELQAKARPCREDQQRGQRARKSQPRAGWQRFEPRQQQQRQQS